MTKDAARPTEPRDSVGEKRLARRMLVIKGATVVFNRGYSSMNCLVLDLSKTGARLRPDDILLCPEQFTLQFPGGVSHLCEAKWRKGKLLGVRFL